MPLQTYARAFSIPRVIRLYGCMRIRESMFFVPEYMLSCTKSHVTCHFCFTTGRSLGPDAGYDPDLLASPLANMAFGTILRDSCEFDGTRTLQVRNVTLAGLAS